MFHLLYEFEKVIKEVHLLKCSHDLIRKYIIQLCYLYFIKTVIICSEFSDPTGSVDFRGCSYNYVSSYNKAGSFRMLTNAYLREQGFIQKLMSYENPH